MNLKKLFTPASQPLHGDLALLLLRIVAGVAFILHGWPKIQNPFNWMGENAFAPGVFQALAALAEFGGGIAWVLGALTPLASLGMAGTMVVAVYVHAVMMGDPFVANGPGGSYEPALGYFCISMVFLALGPGGISVDRLIFGKK